MRRLLLLTSLLVLAAAAPAHAVVSGATAKAKDFPFFAQLNGCGATLVAPDRVLTAAHCVLGSSPADEGQVTFPATGERRSITRIASAPGAKLIANDEAVANDAAIVALDRPVTSVQPVPLVSSATKTGTTVTLVGTGRTSGAQSTHAGFGLHTTTVKAISDSACAAYWRGYEDPDYHRAFKPAQMVCARMPKPYARAGRERSVCQGDSGGPLLVGRRGHYRQAGIVSWLGNRCGVGPSVFAELPKYNAFIQSANPVWAPLPSPGTGAITGTPAVGQTLTCTGPGWATPPDAQHVVWERFHYPQQPQRLQDSAATTYVVAPGDAGHLVGCTIIGETAGGTAVGGGGTVRIGPAS